LSIFRVEDEGNCVEEIYMVGPMIATTTVSPTVAKVYVLLSYLLLVYFIFQENGIPALQNKHSWNYL
jgi:hypothetical protein